MQQPDDELPPRVGPYQVLARLGQGGAATVYLAEASQPRGRRVAVKLLRTGELDPAGVVRFRHELAALSAMAHANVAAVFDAGIWEGRPYFVLEWVADGVPLPEFCRHRRLPLRARLALFLQACAGVQHAHERGLLHCDVTPRNLLVTGGESPVVKVIDFGLARALHGDQPASTHGIAGTVAYLAPEQVTSPGDLDVRVDVYSLGLVLFELLTGRRARDRGGFDAMDLAGQLQIVAAPLRERPSDAGVDPTVGIDPSTLRGPLDWIVAKALAVDRAGRFASVSELADDLRRHLAGLAVEAGPSPWSYRLWAWARQHRSVLAASALVLASLVVGTVAASLVAQAARTAAVAADLARADAERQVERFELLADAARYRQLVAAAQSLWPIGPELVPAIDRWRTEQADPLVARLPLYRSALAELVATATPATAVDAAERSPFHPVGHVLGRVAQWREVLHSSDPAVRAALAAMDTTWIEAYRQALDDAEAAASQGVSSGAAPRVRAANDRDETLLRELTALVGGVEALLAPGGLLAEIVARRERAIGLRLATVDGEAAALAWQQAQRRLQDDPRFDGVVLRPHLGLLPLGRDPRSGLEEFAHLDSGVVPTRDAAGDLVLAPEHGIVLVLLPPAHAHVGAQATDPNGLHYDPQALPDEGPVRAIDIPPWFVSKYELSVAQARRYCSTSSWLREPDLPCMGLSLREADAVGACSGLEVLGADVWEYACRAGTPTPWWSGADVASLSARGEQLAAGNLASSEFGPTLWSGEDQAPLHRDGFRGAAQVSALRPNPFGLHHVVGNLSDLCRGLDGGAVLCGSNYAADPWSARASCRFRVDVDSNESAPGPRFGRRLEP